MIEILVDILSWAALTAGAAFYLIGAIGLIRMPDVFTRMHAASVIETLGVGLLILGMILQAGISLLALKLFIVALILWTTGAVATHALARAALHDGEKPLLTDADGRMKPTDCVTLFPELGVRLAAPLSSETVADAVASAPPGAAAELGAEARAIADADGADELGYAGGAGDIVNRDAGDGTPEKKEGGSSNS